MSNSASDTFFQDINKKKKEKKNFRYYMLNSAYICETICRHSRYAHCLMEKGFVLRFLRSGDAMLRPSPTHPCIQTYLDKENINESRIKVVLIYELII